MSGIIIVGTGKLGPGAGGGATNLSYTASPTGGTVTSDTGTDATVPLSDGTNAGLLSPAQHSKLASIEAGATADMTAAEILAALLTVDGAGSGLDADLLDGQSSAAFEAAGAAASAIAAHVAASDPHPTYTTAAELSTALASYVTLGTANASYQPLDTDLTAIAALASAANKLLYATGAGAWALADLTAFARTLLDDADAATMIATLGAVPQAQSVNAQTGTTYTLVAADAGKLVTLSNASAITLTVPQDSDATIAVGTYVDLYQLGAGQVTVVAGTGATLRVSGLTAKARAQYSRLGVQKVSANTWSLFGDLAAS
jgi:hypothetical protein